MACEGHVSAQLSAGCIVNEGQLIRGQVGLRGVSVHSVRTGCIINEGQLRVTLARPATLQGDFLCITFQKNMPHVVQA